MRWRIIAFTLGLILIGVGTLVTISNVIDFEVYEAVPDYEVLETKTFDFELRDNLYVSDETNEQFKDEIEFDGKLRIDNNAEIVIDDEVPVGTARFNVSFFEEFNNLRIQELVFTDGYLINVSFIHTNNWERFKFMHRNIMDNLKNRVIYVYDLNYHTTEVRINSADKDRVIHDQGFEFGNFMNVKVIDIN